MANAPMRQMAERFISDGMLPGAGDVERLMQLMGRPSRTYGEFAAEHASAGWAVALGIGLAHVCFWPKADVDCE